MAQAETSSNARLSVARTLKKVNTSGVGVFGIVCRSPQCAIARYQRLVMREGGLLPKQSKGVKAKHGENWNDPGPTRKHAQRLYIKYPFMSGEDIAGVLGVSRQVVHKYIKDLTEERKRAREEAIIRLKMEEGL